MTLEKKINMALVYKGISQAELARLLDTTPSNLNLKIKRETLRPGDIEQIAEALGATYNAFFEFPDGTKI
jgi:transcriptional regulator with XRE-family HTH domain